MIKSFFNWRKTPQLVVLAFIFYFLFLNIASAHTSGLWTPGDSIVPCGKTPPAGFVGPLTPEQQPCTQCDLLHLLKHLIDFILVAASPILATTFFIVAGVYMMLGGDNASMLSTGKSIFKNTFIGLLIVVLSWLITNTLIKSLADPSAIGGEWWSFTCGLDGGKIKGEDGSNPNPNPNPNLNPGTVTISGEAVSNRTSSSVTITWTTNIPATSQVHFGPCGNMIVYTPIDSSLVTSHRVTLANLGSNATFCYNVISRGSTGYEASGSILQFQTLP